MLAASPQSLIMLLWVVDDSLSFGLFLQVVFVDNEDFLAELK